MSSHALELLKSIGNQSGSTWYCKGCVNSGTFGEQCVCGCYFLENKPMLNVESSVVPTVKKCAFCVDTNITDLKPICRKCDKTYVLSLRCNFPGSINGWNYSVKGIKYYINPYIGRNSNNINYGIWQVITCDDGDFLDYVENPPLPNKK